MVYNYEQIFKRLEQEEKDLSTLDEQEDNEELRRWRINSWKNRVAPEGYAFPGDPRNWEQEKYETAKLSKLGEKILGLEKW